MKRVLKRVRSHKEDKDSYKSLIVVEGGEDVRFNIGSGRLGAWKGSLTSEMAVDHDGRRVLRWMLDKGNFDKVACDIISEQLDSVWF